MTTKILVAGATGNQGGSVIDHLLSIDDTYELYGLTRNVESARAKALADRGVHVVEGDMTDEARMGELCAGMDGVFCLTTFFEDGIELEIEQGVTLAEAAAEADVAHFVYSSVASADRDTGLVHFDSKYTVERRIEELGMPATVVRPTSFMQNFAAMMAEEIHDGRLVMPLSEGVSLQMIDTDDIGATVAAAFADPERFVGESIDIAGDELTLEEMATTFSAALGHDVVAVHLGVEEARPTMGDEMADMYAWLNEVGFDCDVEGVQAEYGLEFSTLPEYLARSEAFRSPTTAAR